MLIFAVWWVDYPASLIVLDLVLGGPSKGIAGAIGMFAGHAWYVPSLLLYTVLNINTITPAILSFSLKRKGGSYTITSQHIPPPERVVEIRSQRHNGSLGSSAHRRREGA